MEMNNHDRYYNSLHETSYNKLLDLAECDEHDKEAITCSTAMNAMAKIFKYGSCMDKAEGLKYYIDFIQSNNEIVENE